MTISPGYVGPGPSGHTRPEGPARPASPARRAGGHVGDQDVDLPELRDAARDRLVELSNLS
jgi:hypothetical protein